MSPNTINTIHVVLETINEHSIENPNSLGLTGEEIEEITRISFTDINDAIEILDERGYVELVKELGTAPYGFYCARITPQGKLYLEENEFTESQRIIKNSTETHNEKDISSRKANRLGKLGSTLVIPILSGLIVGIVLLLIEYHPNFPPWKNNKQTPTLLSTNVERTTTPIRSTETLLTTSKSPTSVLSTETPTFVSAVYIESEILISNGWDLLLSEKFDENILDDQWEQMYRCDYGQIYVENGKLNINLSTEEEVSLGECSIYPKIALLNNKGKLKIFFEYSIVDSTNNNSWIGFFSGCKEDDIKWLSVVSNKDNLTVQTEKEVNLISSGFNHYDNSIVEIFYTPSSLSINQLAIDGNDPLTECTIPLTSIRFGGGVRENGSITGWIDNIYILTKEN